VAQLRAAGNYWAMAVRSLSFDDTDDTDLCVFSGYDLLISHYDVADLDWQEVAERSAIDERRGLVIAQVAHLEGLIDEFLHYLFDPTDPEDYQRGLDRMMIGARLDRFERGLIEHGLLDDQARARLDDLRAVVRRRNQLAHGTLQCRPTRIVPIKDLAHQDIDLEWVLEDRRARQSERVSMAGLRDDLADAIGTFAAMLAYAETFVELAPAPVHFHSGAYLSAPG